MILAKLSKRLVAGIALCVATSPLALAQTSTGAGKKDAAAILARAKAVLRFDRAAQAALHARAMSADVQNFESDRSYPPYFSSMVEEELWFDPQSGLERTASKTTFPGGGPPEQMMLTTSRRAFQLREGQATSLPTTSMQWRYLDPWAVIADWASAGDASVAPDEVYRDYPRTVLTRKLPDGEQRLYVDGKSGFPVKLDVQEPHYLWGQRHIEYLYANWMMSGGVMVPGSSFRLADGNIEISRTIGDLEVVARNAAPELATPEEPAQPPDGVPIFLQPIDPRVIPVGPQTYLLSNRGFTELVTQVGDEVFLFDSTQGEERARKDAAAIDQLFPGPKKITLVVTDLAWPHVAGVRYWVANGATVVAHRAAREFLQSVIDRRWTLWPDLLEQRRQTAKLKFTAVESAYKLAGDFISVHPIDGIGSEVALMAYLSADRLLWASDFIQTVKEPSLYSSEVWHAVQRAGLHPERAAAEHLQLTPWATIDELVSKDEATTSRHVTELRMRFE